MAYADSLKQLQGLIRHAETLAALGALARIEAGEANPDAKIMSALVQVLNVVGPDFFEGVSQEQASFLGATAFGNLSRILELVASPDKPGNWDYTDPTVLDAQGKSSRAVTRFLSAHAQEDEDFRSILESGEHFLDVGSGVGWISITMAEQWPNIKVDGLEILPPALTLAQKNLSTSSVSNRVRFIDKNLADLDVENEYGAAFVPMMFIPEDVLAAALPLLRKALRPGGILFVAGYRIPEDPLLAALNNLQTVISGGRVWTEEELSELLRESGFVLGSDVAPAMPISIHRAQ